MRAAVITSPGGPDVLAVEEVPIRSPDRGEIRVRVRAAGINRADLLQRRGRYPPPPGWPTDIPGLEYAGEIEEVGTGVESLRVGDRVMGLVGGGGCAEFVVVPEREAIPIPSPLSFEQAAAVPEVFITAHDALFTQLALHLGERLLIHAVGSGVGTAALQLAKAAGCTVLGGSRSHWKLERAAELGLDVLIDSSTVDIQDVVGRVTGGEGVHAVLDLIGGPFFSASVASLAVKGRLMLVGLTAGRTSELDLSIILRKRLTVRGTSLRMRPLEEKIAAARAFERDVCPLLRSGAVQPVIDRVFALEEVVQAHEHMEANANFGKIVLNI